jgi:hypothetical protein
VLCIRRKCISCKPLHLHQLMCFCCAHRMIQELSLLLLTHQITRSLILCRRKWIPSVLFPREARVLLDIVTSRRTFRREEVYMCIILLVHGVSLLTGWTHLHSVQKPSASQPLPLVMKQAGGKQARSACRLPTPLHGRLGPSRGFKVRTLISFSKFLRNF